ncbi:DNA-binding protein [Nakamurella sp. YIM 132087]|uniref:DNA-binding protein n=1 Tax=Nakamurella alba TaxID=2665158 RepID=A0A7K1FTB7_9ACTN|nr:Rv2175c family DNA-binding protein [Nakamurella alba]MTD17378.1 DNA-binding protein [Nakamurella alba]
MSTPAAPAPDAGPPTWVPVPDIAEALGIVVTKVHQLVRERSLIAVREGGVVRIPAEFVSEGLVVKGLPGTITLLTDAGYSDAEIVTWLFESDESLPGRPITALRENRGREVHRRAQAAGF